MDEDLNDEQRVLLEASSRFIEDTCPLERQREGAFDDRSFADRYRRQAAELGWYSFTVPEVDGGGSTSGNGVLDAALVSYRRGRLLQPDPFISTNVVAHAVATAGHDVHRTEILPALMGGDCSAGWAIAAAGRAVDIDGVATAIQEGDGYRLRGRATSVEDPGPDGWLLVTTRATGGVTQFLLPTDAPGVRVEPMESLDITRRFMDVHFDDALVPATALIGEPGAAADLVDRQLALACVLTAAESVGAMDEELAITVAYAKDRIAFGRPIGSFQAVKHQLADTSLNLEMSKAVTHAAATNLGADDYGLESASMAKSFVGDCGIDLAQTCFQVFGGIGFTWEHDQHLYLRRLTMNASLFGDPAWHRERLCHLGGVGAGPQ